MANWTDLGLSYLEAMHGVQSAVGYEMNAGLSKAHEPKHLRVGVNSAMVEHGAMISLLVKKGVITEEEFMEELRLAANHELARYEAAYPPIKFR